jgi:hypothetical protein
MCICSLRYAAYNSLYTIFPHYLINSETFLRGGGELWNIKCLFLFSLQLLSVTFRIIRRTEWDMIKNVYWTSCKKVPIILVRLKWNVDFPGRFFKNTRVLNFMKICPVGAELLHADLQTNMMKLIVTFRKCTY